MLLRTKLNILPNPQYELPIDMHEDRMTMIQESPKFENAYEYDGLPPSVLHNELHCSVSGSSQNSSQLGLLFVG